MENPGSKPSLVYTECVTKTNQGGLLHQKKQPKQVMHHANVTFPE